MQSRPSVESEWQQQCPAAHLHVACSPPTRSRLRASPRMRPARRGANSAVRDAGRAKMPWSGVQRRCAGRRISPSASSRPHALTRGRLQLYPSCTVCTHLLGISLRSGCGFVFGLQKRSFQRARPPPQAPPGCARESRLSPVRPSDPEKPGDLRADDSTGPSRPSRLSPSIGSGRRLGSECTVRRGAHIWHPRFHDRGLRNDREERARRPDIGRPPARGFENRSFPSGWIDRSLAIRPWRSNPARVPSV